MANLGERRVYPLRPGLKYRFTPSRDPNHWWDDVNDVKTIHGLLEVDDINTPKFKVKDVNVTGDLTLSGLTADRLLYLDTDSNVASVSALTDWIAGRASEIEIGDDLDGTITIGIINPLIVGKGGTGAATLADGFVLLGNATGAIQALDVTTDGGIIIGDGTTDPVVLDVGSSTAITILGTIATGTWQATDIGVQYGGTGVSSLTDGGVLLGSGTSAITAMTVLADSEFIVGDGTTDPVAESGNTARTSLGVGTGDSPTFTGLTVDEIIIDGEDTRKHSLVDEPTWYRTVTVPLSVGTTGWVKDGGNPVIDDDDIPDAAMEDVHHPCVVFDGTYFWMFVATRDKESSAEGDIYVFRATDPDGAWSIWNNNTAIIARGAGGTYDEDECYNPSVVIDYDATGTGTDFKWKMMYSASEVGTENRTAAYAYADDPPSSSTSAWTWTKYAGNPVIAFDATQEPDLGFGFIKLGKRFVLVNRHRTNKNVVSSYSVDCITWTKLGLVIPLGVDSWDSDTCSYTNLYFDSGILYLFYSGYDGTYYKIGMAYSANLNLNSSVIKDITNPILSVGAATTWEEDYVFSPSVVRIKNKWHMWYTGVKDTVRAVGHATLDMSNFPL